VLAGYIENQSHGKSLTLLEQENAPSPPVGELKAEGWKGGDKK
jgi:hypothetical protein